MQTNDFSKGKVWRRIVAQAIPLTLAQLVQLLYNVVDRIFIGHIPGDSSLPLTGVGICLPIITLISAFSSFAGSGGAPLAAIELGKSEKDSSEDFSSLKYC